MTYHGITTLFLTLLFITTTALPPTQINSNSILIALLDSQYTELSELIEKALLLQTLEHSLTQNNLTIFAPNNEALQHDLDPEFKQFLLEPRNLKSLQNLLLFHFVPSRIYSSHLHAKHKTLCNNHFLSLKTTKVTRPVILPDRAG
ncbi:FAS1 domain-containing protein [Heracleum sosnowskyi]|uniref:FAS1 domain-containing protein n=1 Tax=Heracleum sosnowskyi TaxID=360622 RepID=A0AAD8J7I4_9APIA|nr:FAS1 domain-containing protein [Heracleum sosnowskyi]